MRERPALTLLRWLIRALPGRALAASLLLVAGGLLEGLSALALLPLLEALGIPGAAAAPLGIRIPYGIAGAVLFFAALQALVALLAWLNARHAGTLMVRLVAWLRGELLDGLVHMRWRVLRGKDAGALQSLLTWETERVGQAVFALVTACTGLTVAAIYLVVAFAAQPLLAALIVLAGGALALLVHPVGRRAGASGQQLAATYRAMGTGASQWLANLRLAALDGSGTLHGAFASGSKDAQALTVHAIHRQADSRLLFTVGGVAILAGVVLVASQQGVLAATLLLVVYIGMRALPRFQMAQSYLQNLRLLLPAVLPVAAALQEARQERETAPASVPPLLDGIRLEEVRLDWGAGGLQGVTATLPRGQLTVVAGPSGAGKTTMAEVALGLLEPDAGHVAIDGIPLDGPRRIGWRRRCAYVPQEPTLPFPTLRRNLAWARPDATEEEMGSALTQAHAQDVTSRGLDGDLGPGGSSLSGGQRQRVALAMAMVRNVDFVVLDEPTSAQDPVTEARLIETLRDLRKRTTLLVIAHRPALQDAADQVLRLQGGRLETTSAPPQP